MKATFAVGKAIAFSLLISTFSQACKEDEVLTEATKTDTIAEAEEVVAASRIELTLDSLFLYAKEIYLWNDALPEYEEFNPRAYTYYTTDLANLDAELFDITQCAVNPATGEPYEYYPLYGNYPKYSYIELNESPSGVSSYRSSSPLDGSDDDYGFGLTAVAADDIRIRYVTTGSTAANAGINRGDKLTKVNGNNVRADSQSDVNLINNAFDQSNFTLTVEKQDGSTLETTLVKSTYTLNPVFKDTVLERSGARVGYLAYDMFTSLGNSEDPLNEAFAEFAATGVTHLVVDLRYNGGGYVATAEYLCNLIAPNRLNGQVMYTERFNELMQQGNATILENQVLKDENGDPVTYRGRNATYADLDYSEEGNTYTFSKKGSLGTIQDVYFIISEETASASELVINTLKPYLNVTLIGSTSYGKPVGFFGIQIDQYTVYMANFLTVNSAGEGDYFSGLDPDIASEDDITHDFGDPEETCLSIALALIEGAEIPTARTSSWNARTSSFTDFQIRGSDHDFQGMIETRRTIRP